MENQNENFAAQENQNPTQDAPQNSAPQQNPTPIKKIPKVNMIISAVSIVIIIVCAIVILNLGGGSTITMDEYNQIKNGMSYDEVCDIIGGEGELVSEAGDAAVYTW